MLGIHSMPFDIHRFYCCRTSVWHLWTQIRVTMDTEELTKDISRSVPSREITSLAPSDY